MKALGVDLGAITVKAVLLDEDLKVLHLFKKKRGVGLKEGILKFIKEIGAIDEEFLFGLTGFESMEKEFFKLNLINNIFALAKGVSFLHPDA